MVYYGITKNQSEKLYLQIISCAEDNKCLWHTLSTRNSKYKLTINLKRLNF